jgi:hypothetical protein
MSQWLRRGFGLVIGFINNLQVVTTINYYIIVALHNLQSHGYIKLTVYTTNILYVVKHNTSDSKT